MDNIQIMVLFIAAYLLWMIARWLILPHLKIFPYIPPQILWVTLYNILAYIATMVFHWVLMALLIIYIIWIIIKKFVPNFPIPFKTILLAIPPFPPLEAAGILPLIDNMVNILLSGMPFGERLRAAGTAFGEYIMKSVTFILGSIKDKIPVGTLPADSPKQVQQSTPAPDETDPDKKFQQKEIDQEYSQCVEENTIPVTEDLKGISKAQAMIKNSAAKSQCKMQMLQAYSRALEYQDL
jgi:hypothetical protein